jgi:hypothetical protein
MLYKRKNPAVMDRINAVNGLLCSVADQGRKDRRLYIDPSCRELVADMEEVKWKVDAHGNTYDKLDERDSKRTHVVRRAGLLHRGGARTSESGDRSGIRSSSESRRRSLDGTCAFCGNC